MISHTAEFLAELKGISTEEIARITKNNFFTLFDKGEPLMKAQVTILGCGNSSGVPAVGNYWGACDPDEPKNTRTRCSIAVQSDKTTIVIDTGPDFRHQINRENISKLTAVFYTHAHSDHVAGIDDLRVFRFRNKALVPIYANKETLQTLGMRVPYLIDGGDHTLYPPVLEPNEITPAMFGRSMAIGDIEFTPFEQDHGTVMTLGYRFGDFGYSVDIHKLDDRAVETLQGVKTLGC